MNKNNEAGQSLSSESIALLEQVKKGKVRKFAMICKGTSVVSLVVYKKGNVEKRRKEAKEAGKGQFYFGVVDGKGLDLRFVLARSDGFDSEPVKRTALKSFLEDAAELKFKPYFEIVDCVPLVLDEDDPLVARFLLLQKRSQAAELAFPQESNGLTTLCRQAASHLDRDESEQALDKIEALQALLDRLQPASSTQPSPDSSHPSTTTEAPSAVSADIPEPPPPPSIEDRELFLSRLKVLKPKIDQAALSNSPTAASIKELAGQAGTSARQQQFGEALLLLDKIEAALVQLASAATTTAQSSSDPAAAFTARLKKLLPVIGQAKTGSSATDKEIVLQASQAATAARAGDFVNANLCLDQIDKLTTPASAQADFTARFKAIKPLLDKVLAGGPPLSDRAKPLAVEAATLARSQNYPAALTALARLEELLRREANPNVGSDQAPPEKRLGPKVALQQSVLQWDDARKRINAQLEQLENEIMELFENDPRMSDVQDQIHRLDDVLAHYADDLRDELDNAYQAVDDQRPQYVASALKVLQEYRQYLNTEPFIKDVATNLLMPIDIEGILGQALDTIGKRLSA